MPNNKKILEYSYNPQVTADSSFGIIISNDVSSEIRDVNHLQPQMLDGYIPDEKRASILNRTEGKPENPSGKENFEYDPAEDCFICPNDKKLTFRFEYVDITKNRNVRIYKGTQCKQCPDRKKCSKNSRDGKVIKDYEGVEAERRNMADKMLSREGALIYQTRKKVVECIFGHIKRNLGFREFLLRGIKGAKIEFNLVCIASNLRRIWNFMNGFSGIKC